MDGKIRERELHLTDLVTGIQHLKTLSVLTTVTVKARVTAASCPVNVHWDVPASVNKFHLIRLEKTLDVFMKGIGVPGWYLFNRQELSRCFSTFGTITPLILLFWEYYPQTPPHKWDMDNYIHIFFYPYPKNKLTVPSNLNLIIKLTFSTPAPVLLFHSYYDNWRQTRPPVLFPLSWFSLKVGDFSHQTVWCSYPGLLWGKEISSQFSNKQMINLYWTDEPV